VKIIYLFKKQITHSQKTCPEKRPYIYIYIESQETQQKNITTMTPFLLQRNYPSTKIKGEKRRKREKKYLI